MRSNDKNKNKRLKDDDRIEVFGMNRKKSYTNLIKYKEVKKNTTLDGYMAEDAEVKEDEKTD